MVEYKLVFLGKLTGKYSVEEVGANLKSSLKMTDQAIAQLFKPRMNPLVVKRVPSFDKANQLCTRFSDLGLILDIVEVDKDAKQQVTQSKPEKPRGKQKPAVQDPAIESESDSAVGERLKGFLASIFGLSTLIIILGVYLCYSYMPYPDGMLRNGFVAGLVALFLGWRNYLRVN